MLLRIIFLAMMLLCTSSVHADVIIYSQPNFSSNNAATLEPKYVDISGTEFSYATITAYSWYGTNLTYLYREWGLSGILMGASTNATGTAVGWWTATLGTPLYVDLSVFNQVQVQDVVYQASSTCAVSDCPWAIKIYAEDVGTSTTEIKIVNVSPNGVNLATSTVQLSVSGILGISEKNVGIQVHGSQDNTEDYSVSWYFLNASTTFSLFDSHVFLAGTYYAEAWIGDSYFTADVVYPFTFSVLNSTSTVIWNPYSNLWASTTASTTVWQRCALFTSTWDTGECVKGLVIPDVASLTNLFKYEVQNGVFSRAPWGYVTRVLDKLWYTESTSTLPSLVFTVPAGMPMAGASIDLSPWQYMAGDGSILATAVAKGDTVPFMTRVKEYWEWGWILLFGFWLLNLIGKSSLGGSLFGFGTSAKEGREARNYIVKS